jgi:hypothetical protein
MSFCAEQILSMGASNTTESGLGCFGDRLVTCSRVSSDEIRHQSSMFSRLFKSPAQKLEARYHALLKEAQTLQRTGKIPEFAKKTAEAEAVRHQLEELEQKAASK